jgi:hypothetical protein
MAEIFARPKLLTDKQISTIRGKAMVGHASVPELMSVFGHYDLIEMELDKCDYDDLLGTEGWRHRFRLPDAD